MPSRDETCWTLIRDAAGGNDGARTAFAGSYLPLVRAYLGARWGRGPLRNEIADAVQDVFLECLKSEGALARAAPDHPGRFRTFLYAVVRNVALRYEERRARHFAREGGRDFELAQLAADEPRLSAVFDRSWADHLLKRAVARMRESAAAEGEEAVRRVELLRLRFAENLPIREIAERWGADPAIVHRQYARAREEYKAALSEEVAFHQPGLPGEVDRRMRELLALIA